MRSLVVVAAALRGAGALRPPSRPSPSRSPHRLASAARDVFCLSSFSEGVLGNGEVARLLREACSERSEGGKVTLCYVPTASNALRRTSVRTPGVQRQRSRRDAKQKRDRIVDFFGGPSACDAVTLDLSDASLKHVAAAAAPRDGAEALCDWASLVVVDGGNTFWLRHCMERWLGTLRDESDGVYVGVSAGAICAGRHVDTALWKGWDDPEVVPGDVDWAKTPGLDLAGGATFFPHHDEAAYGDLVSAKREDRHAPLVALEEGGAYVVPKSGGPARYVPPPPPPPSGGDKS